jgi:predicted RNase H-like HicB family nuclease
LRTATTANARYHTFTAETPEARRTTIVTTVKSRHIPSMRTIHAVFQNDGAWFIARCLDFAVTTQGRTLAAAKKNLEEAVELYLETWGDAGTKPAKEVYLTSIEVGA